MRQRDNVVAMRQWITAHPGAEWKLPEGESRDHVVTYRAADGTLEQQRHHDLGVLLDFLLALDRGNEATGAAAANAAPVALPTGEVAST